MRRESRGKNEEKWMHFGDEINLDAEKEERWKKEKKVEEKKEEEE